MDKDLIKKRFIKSLKTYDRNAIVQKQMASNIVNFLSGNNKFAKVLELGCGTGILTGLLQSNFDISYYCANDIIEDCRQYVNVDEFICEDLDVISDKIDTSFDLIVSNAAFQWSKDLPVLIANLYNKLSKGGTLLFSVFGERNFEEITKITNVGLESFDKTCLCKYKDYFIEEEIIQLEFNNAYEVLKHMQLTGVNAITSCKWVKSDFYRFCKSYNPIYVRINKNDSEW